MHIFTSIFVFWDDRRPRFAACDKLSKETATRQGWVTWRGLTDNTCAPYGGLWSYCSWVNCTTCQKWTRTHLSVIPCVWSPKLRIRFQLNLLLIMYSIIYWGERNCHGYRLNENKILSKLKRSSECFSWTALVKKYVHPIACGFH
jgi:hypothetical protein